MKVAPNQVKKKTPVKAGASARKAKTGDVKKSAQDIILELLAESAGIGEESLPRERLTKGTGLAAKTVNNNITKLKQKGWVDYDAKTIHLTENGMESSGAMANVPKTNAEIHERTKSKLKGKEILLFEMLADGNVRDRNEVAQALGYENMKTKAFLNVVGKLSGQGIAEYPDKQSVQLSDKCFRFGRGKP